MVLILSLWVFSLSPVPVNLHILNSQNDVEVQWLADTKQVANLWSKYHFKSTKT